MKRVISFVFVAIFLSFSVLAQSYSFEQTGGHGEPVSYGKKSRSSQGNPFRFYGGFGLGFSNHGFYVDIQPGLLYRVRPAFHVGANAQLGYQSYRNFNVRTHTYIYGYDLLALYLPWQHLELSIDYQQLYIRYEAGSATTRWQVPAFYLGMAYRTRNAAIGFRYDLLYKEGKSIYPSAFTPFVRIYF
ncbi:MAG: hypothetical protein GXO24_05945 [Chlorobi bacterium]|nr:hypothetical protein [Chlorobiota bacterium]